MADDKQYVLVESELLLSPCGVAVGIWLVINRRRFAFVWFPPYLPPYSQN